MKILVTGATGMLGWELTRALDAKHQLFGLCRTGTSGMIEMINADVSDKSSLCASIQRINPDLVIHAAAQSNVDACESDPEAAWRINAIGTRNVALACQRFDTEMVYISTDLVFSGSEMPPEGYTEFDPPCPVNVYGRTKLQGELFVQQLLRRWYIVRPSWMFGSRRENFVSSTVSTLVSGGTVKAADDMVSSPSYAADVAVAISQLVGTGRYGTWHITNSGVVSRYDVALEVARVIGTPTSLIQKVTIPALRFAAPRPGRSGLRNYVWEIEGRKPLRSWKAALAAYLKETVKH